MQTLMNGGTAVLLVSHDLQTVETLSHRVLWLDHGHVRMLGTLKRWLRPTGPLSSPET